MVNESLLPAVVKQTTGLLHGSVLPGCEVVGDQGTALGTVVDWVSDSAAGTIAYVVVASGGFMGIGEVRHALPWSHLTCLEDGKRFRCLDGRLLPCYRLA